MFFSNSLGCYIALSTINQLINLNIDLPKCVVIQNPFYSIFDIGYELYGKISFLLPIKMNNNKNIKKILNNQSNYKIFVLHSIYDEFIKITHSEKLCKNNIFLWQLKKILNQNLILNLIDLVMMQNKLRIHMISVRIMQKTI
jgi:hypothetical protein